MASNRKLPFGYRMEQGQIKEHPVEAKAVRDIFSRYLAGASFAALAEYLKDNGPPYDGDKPWNKNMVARILETAKYTGGGGFPALVQSDNFQKAQTRRKSRTTPSSKTPTQKKLRRLCGGNPPKYIEGQVLGILNRLASALEIIQCPSLQPEDTSQISGLRQELASLLERAPVDEDASRKIALNLEAEQWKAIGSEEYETERLRWLFSKADPQNELDAGLLHTSVQQITIQNRRAIVRLKNGQTMEGAT